LRHARNAASIAGQDKDTAARAGNTDASVNASFPSFIVRFDVFANVSYQLLNYQNQPSPQSNRAP